MPESATLQQIGNFGAEILGLDLGKEDALNNEVMQFLCEALYANQVIVIRNQNLDKDRYLEFGRQWGQPIPHVLDHMRMANYPEMMTVGNTEKRDQDTKIRNGAALWHTDQSYEAVPASATMLYSIKAPEVGGETQFCNMRMAYDALDDQQKSALNNVEIAHKYGYGKRHIDEAPVNPLINEDQDQRVPPVFHPLVMSHPVSGQRALYALGHGAYQVEGYQGGDPDSLLDTLKSHALQEQFIYRHKYRPGDLVIWDTLQTMHRATVIDVPQTAHEERLLWRISVRNKPRIYA